MVHKGSRRRGVYTICVRQVRQCSRCLARRLLTPVLVWALRGWSDKEGSTGKEDKRSWQSYELSRADGKAVPKWKEVEHRPDGKHRLGYNPARETKDISRYHFEGVRAEGKRKNKANDEIQFQRKGGDRAALAKL